MAKYSFCNECIHMWHKPRIVIMYEINGQKLCNMTFLHNRGIMCRKKS